MRQVQGAGRVDGIWAKFGLLPACGPLHSSAAIVHQHAYLRRGRNLMLAQRSGCFVGTRGHEGEGGIFGPGPLTGARLQNPLDRADPSPMHRSAGRSPPPWKTCKQEILPFVSLVSRPPQGPGTGQAAWTKSPAAGLCAPDTRRTPRCDHNLVPLQSRTAPDADKEVKKCGPRQDPLH